MMELYGEGLARIFDAIDEAGEDGARIRAQLVDDGVVASLMLIHDLYPVALETRVEEALASVRPYLESHGGNVELLGRRRRRRAHQPPGPLQGCPASAATLELAIKQAIDEAAPDLLGLEVEGIAHHRHGRRPAARPDAAARHRRSDGWRERRSPPAAVPAWLPLDRADDVAPGTVRRSSSAAPAARGQPGRHAARLPGRVPRLLAALADGSLQGDVLTCGGCGRAFDLPAAGRALDGAGAPLEPVPLLRATSGPWRSRSPHDPSRADRHGQRRTIARLRRIANARRGRRPRRPGRALRPLRHAHPRRPPPPAAA